MESPSKASVGVSYKYQREAKGSELVLRSLAFALTMAATIVMGVDKQSKIVPFKLIDSLPALNVPLVAKWQYLSACQFFLASNVIASAYAAISLIIAMSIKKNMTHILLILDMIMLALLCSSDGATASLGLLAYQGNSHLLWKKVCNVFGRFCSQIVVAIALSLFGTIAFVLLISLAALRLHKNPN